MTGNTLLDILIAAPPLLLAIILHEMAHGWMAMKLGDPTAYKLGRITLNPLRHIDPVMTIMIPGLLILAGSPFIFGGAKPVPVNPAHFKNPRREMAYVALAGPATNLLLAIGFYLLFRAFTQLFPLFAELPTLPLLVLTMWLINSVLINILLAVFNLLPVPPLDGGRIAVGFLPLNLARYWAKLEPIGLIIVLLLLFSGAIEVILQPVLELSARFLLQLQ